MGERITSEIEGARASELLTAEQEVELSQAIEAGELASWAAYMLKDADEIPENAIVVNDVSILSAERMSEYESVEELISDLKELAQRGKQAKDTFILKNLGLVWKMVRKYEPYLKRLYPEDLAHDIIVDGLVRAVETFDYTRGFKFSTHADGWIHHATSKSLAENDELFRLSDRKRQELRKLKNAYDQLSESLGRQPTNDEIAEKMGIEPAKVSQLVKNYLCILPLELDKPIDEDGTTRGEITPDQSPPVPELVSRKIDREMLEDMISELSETDQFIVRERFFTDEPRTSTDVARELGLSESGFRGRERRLLRKLREMRLRGGRH